MTMPKTKRKPATPIGIKVWAEIELEWGPGVEDHQEHERHEEPVSLGRFTSVKEAEAFVNMLSGDGFDVRGLPLKNEVELIENKRRAANHYRYQLIEKLARQIVGDVEGMQAGLVSLASSPKSKPEYWFGSFSDSYFDPEDDTTYVEWPNLFITAAALKAALEA